MGMTLEQFYEINKDGSSGTEAWANLPTTTLDDLRDWHEIYRGQREEVSFLYDYIDCSSDDGTDYMLANIAANKEAYDSAMEQYKNVEDEDDIDPCVSVLEDESFDYIGFDKIEKLTGDEVDVWFDKVFQLVNLKIRRYGMLVIQNPITVEEVVKNLMALPSFGIHFLEMDDMDCYFEVTFDIDGSSYSFTIIHNGYDEDPEDWDFEIENVEEALIGYMDDYGMIDDPDHKEMFAALGYQQVEE